MQPYAVISKVPVCAYLQKSNIYPLRKSYSAMELLDYDEISHDSRCFLRLISRTLKLSDHYQGKYCKNMTV